MNGRRATSGEANVREVMATKLVFAAMMVFAVGIVGCTGRTAVGPAVASPEAPADDRILILISLDGFRWDYVDWPEAENVRALAVRGVRADGLIPPFPSKTFPSHYTIVTGLTPGKHGVISNYMRDPNLGTFSLGDRAAVEDPRWWGGEPIWVTASRAGKRTAAMFWPGTETEIGGRRPDVWHRWDSAFPYAQRVDRVLEWLDRPRSERPHLITLYFQDPNDTAHEFGPEAPETRAAIRRVDIQLGRLVAGIASRALADTVDLIVVSDHGMAAVGPEQVISLDRWVELEEGELFEQGAFVQIFPRPGREAMIFDALDGAHPHLAVYRRAEVPARFGLAGSQRLAPIVGVPEVGWEALADRSEPFTLRGDHGQDPSDPRMHGILVAAGPRFRRGVKTGRVESVELYNLMARILEIEPAPNDGLPSALTHLLVDSIDPAKRSVER